MHQSLIFVTLLFASSRFVIEAAVNPDEGSGTPCEGENCEAKAEKKCVEDPNIKEPYKLNADPPCMQAAIKNHTIISGKCHVELGELAKFRSGFRKCDCCGYKDKLTCLIGLKLVGCENLNSDVDQKVLKGLCKCVNCNDPEASRCPGSTSQPNKGGGGENGDGNNSGGSGKNSGDSKHNGDGPKASGAGLKVVHLPYKGFLLILAAQLSLRVLLF